jgi:DNA adenine methylase
MKPPFKYSGGKRRELKNIVPLLPNHFDRVIEPFCGAAAVAFHLEKPSILSDMRGDLIETYKQIGYNWDELSQWLEWMKGLDYNTLQDLYYETRSSWTKDTSGIELAKYFITIRQLGFSGMDRINSKTGRSNVPFSHYKSFNSVLSKNHRDFIRNSEILHCDWTTSFDMGTENDFVFLDPPYLNRNSRYNGTYDNNLQLHYDIANRFKNTNAKCMIVHVDCELYRELFRDFNITTIPFMYAQNFKGRDNSKASVNHLYITNY